MEILISAMLNSLASIYITSKKVTNQKNNIVKMIIFIFCYSALITSTYFFVLPIYKVIINYTGYAILYYLLLERNIKKAIYMAFLIFIIFFIAEILFVVTIVFLLGKTPVEFIEGYLASVITNILISVYAVLIYQSITIKKLFDDFYKLYSKNYNLRYAFLFLLFIGTMGLLLYHVYFTLTFKAALITNTILVLAYLYIISLLLKENYYNNVINERYKGILKNIDEYKISLERAKSTVHEFNNNLIVIKSFIKSKKATEFINELLADSGEHGALAETACISEPGLRGLIFQKLTLMKVNGINYSLIVDKKVKATYFESIDTITKRQIYTITGIMLDNIIEACLDSKGATGINIYYSEKSLYLSFVNEYAGTLDLSMIDKRGFSTKGENRGLGLDIVKNIIKSNEKLTLNREVIGKIFKQTLKIEL